MNPDTALLLLLIVIMVMAAVGAPITLAVRGELENAKAKVSNYAALGLLIFVGQWVSLGLWWYYALATDQILIAAIPTVATVWGWLLRVVMKATA